MRVSYAQQKLWEAARSLIGPGTMQARLVEAARALILGYHMHVPAFPAYSELQ